MTMNRLVATLFLFSLSPLAYAEGSPWLQAHGNTTISIDVTSGSTSDFFIGDESTPLGGDIEGTFIWFNASYGYDDIWAFDFRTGYAETNFDSDNPVPGEEDINELEDIADTSFGVSYQIFNEFELDNGTPTVAVRAGLTIGGDYETDVIQAIGDGADGVDLSLLVGKSVTQSIALFGDLTYRARGSNVADGVKYLLSAYYTTPIQGLGVQIAGGGIRTDSDVNIGPGFTVDQFPETDRDSDWLILGANYGFQNGFGLGASFSTVLSGKNIADSNIGTLSLSYSF